MTIVRLKGLKRYQHPATGKWYCYHRQTGTRIKADYGTPEFFAELAAIKEKDAPRQPAPGSIGMVIKAYRKSPGWADLRPATRSSYERGFAALKPIELMPLVEIDRPFVVGLQEKVFHKRGRWLANYAVTVLSILCEYAMDRGWMKANPADGVRRLKRDRSKPKANRPWSRAESHAVLAALAPHMRLPIALAMYTGLRKGDVLKVEKSAIREGSIRVTTAKREVAVAVPIHPDLQIALDAGPAHNADTIAANSFGRPWTESGFNSSFGKAIDRLEKAGVVEPGLTMHGLRHTLGTRLREAGADLDDIRRILGQKTLTMAQHYSATADTSKQAREMLTHLDMTGDKPP